MKSIEQVLPWSAASLPPCPFAHEGYFAFNPSIHREPDGRLLCVVRCADYCRPNGISQMKRPGRVHTRNVLLELHPDTLEVIAMAEIAERDGLPRAASVTSGFEDVRLFRAGGKLLAIATTLQLRGGGNAEMVLLEVDGADAAGLGEIAFCRATPLRGAFHGSWSDFPQKNWAPFDGHDEPRFLFSIERGVAFDAKGPLSDPGHRVPVETTRPVGSISYNGAVETRVEPTFAPADRATGQETITRQMYDWTPGALRGGSQVVPLGDGRWLGIAHGVKHTAGGMHVIPNYWHVWHVCDDRGKLLAKSEPMKLTQKGIELAMGLAVDLERDRAVVSFGVEDMEAKLGVTSISAVLAAMGQAMPSPRFVRPVGVAASVPAPAPVTIAASATISTAPTCPHCGQAMPATRFGQAPPELAKDLEAQLGAVPP